MVTPQGPISEGDEIREISPPTKKNVSLGLVTIEVPANGPRRRSGGR